MGLYRQSRRAVFSTGDGWRYVCIAGAAAIWILAVFVALTTIAPSESSAFRFLAYVFLFNLVPGLVIAGPLLPRLRLPGTFLIYALAAGTTANIFLFTVLWLAGVPHAFRAYPILALGAVVVYRRRLGLAERFGAWVVGRTEVAWAAGAVLICGTPLMTMANLLSDNPGGSAATHFAFQGVLVHGLELGWPPPNLSASGLTLSYHYAAHLWVLAAMQNTGLDLGLLVARYGPLYFLSCAVAVVFAFGRFVLRLPAWTATLPVVAVFWCIGIPAIFGRIFALFTPHGGALIMSPALGFTVFFQSLTLFIEARVRTDWLGIVGPLLTGVTAFIVTGARGVSGPILICALALLLVIEWRRTGAVGRNTLVHLLSAALGLLAAMAIFFTLGQGFSGTGFVTFIGVPFRFLSERQSVFNLPALLIAMGVTGLLAGAIGFLVIAVFQAGFLTAGFFYEIDRVSRSSPTDAEILLLGTSAAGIAGTFMSEAPGLSHFSFIQYASISMAMLGAQGLRRAVATAAGRTAPSMRDKLVPVLVTTGCVLMLMLQLSELPSSMFNWLGHHAGAAVAGISTPSPSREIGAHSDFGCTKDHSADDLLAMVPESSAVVIVPSATALARPCEYVWLFVGQPRESVNPYALEYMAGRPSGPLAALLTRRRDHMTAVMNDALSGIVSPSDLIAVAQTLPKGQPVFVLTGKDAKVDESPQIVTVAEEGPVMLLIIAPQALPD